MPVKVDIKGITTWIEWRKAWEDTRHMNILLGLLHSGFDAYAASEEEWGDRICFYLDVANWEDEPLATKARAVLANNFFSDQTNRRDPHRRIHGDTLLKLPGVFEKTVWFMRGDGKGGLKNLPSLDHDYDDRVKQTMVAFALGFSKMFWIQMVGQPDDWWGQRCWRSLRGVLEFVATSERALSYAWFVSHYQRPRSPSICRIRETLRTEILQELERIALSLEYPFPDAVIEGRSDAPIRKVKSIEEAAWAGFPVGRFLVVTRALIREQERFDELVANKRAIAQAQSRMRELST